MDEHPLLVEEESNWDSQRSRDGRRREDQEDIELQAIGESWRSGQADPLYHPPLQDEDHPRKAHTFNRSILSCIRYSLSVGSVVLPIAFFFLLVDRSKGTFSAPLRTTPSEFCLNFWLRAGLELDTVGLFLILSSDALIALFYFFIPGAMFAVVIQRGVQSPSFF